MPIPSTEVREAISRLDASPDFRKFLEWLASMADEEMERAVYATADADVLRGRAQATADILKTVHRNEGSITALNKRRYRKAGIFQE